MIAIRPLRRLLVLALALCALAPLALPPRAVAASNLTFTVNTTVDAPDATPGDGICADSSGQCTLRAAVQEADAQPQSSSITITLPAGHYVLTLGVLPLLATTITIVGAGSGATVLDGNLSSQVLSISQGSMASLVQVTIAGGSTSGNGEGGGITNAGQLVLISSVVSRNVAAYGLGGGIDNTGRLTLRASTIIGNTASDRYRGAGGGIHNHGGGIVTVSGSTIVNNGAFFGGGIANDAGSVVTLNTSTIGGNEAYKGGGLENDGTVLLSDSTIVSNTAIASAGGGIFNAGAAMVTRSSIISNTTARNALAGGIYNIGTLTVTLSTITGNMGSWGGGINNAGRVILSGSTIAGNIATQSGGGIYANTDTMTLTDSTVVSNTAPIGGGIYNGIHGRAALSYVTIAGNSSDLDDDTTSGPASIVLTGTIVANSSAGPNCTGPMTEVQGDNLDDGTSCGFSQTTDLTNTNPLLGPLAHNGGPTQTIALLPGSPAIDHGGASATGCPPTDQRGMPRPDEPSDNGACDIGAYESQGLG